MSASERTLKMMFAVTILMVYPSYGPRDYYIYTRNRKFGLIAAVTCLVIALHLTNVCAICCGSIRLQWNLSIADTVGTQLAVLYREVSLIQR